MPYMSVGSLSYDVENEEKSVVRNYEASHPPFDARDIAGLGALDPEAMEGLRKLDPRIVAIIAEEMKEPDQRPVLLELLRSPDPAKAVADQMTAELMDEIGLSSRTGMDGLGRSLKKAFKKTIKKIGKPIVKVAKKYGTTIVGITGAVLAPFTGGLSLAAAGAVTAGIGVLKAKKAAKDAKAAARKDAAVLDAEAKKQEAEIQAQLGTFYGQNTELMTSLGFPPATWNAMSLDDKLAALDKIAKGEIKVPASAPPVAGAPTPPTPECPPGFIPFKGGCQSVSPIIHEKGLLPSMLVQPDVFPHIPPRTSPGIPAGAPIEIVVEGVKSGPFPTLEAAVKAALSSAGPGERFEIAVGGASTGLRIRTTDGYTEVPKDIAEKVRAMPKEEIAAAVTKVEKKGGFPWWLIAIPAVAVAAAA